MAKLEYHDAANPRVPFSEDDDYDRAGDADQRAGACRERGPEPTMSEKQRTSTRPRTPGSRPVKIPKKQQIDYAWVQVNELRSAKQWLTANQKHIPGGYAALGALSTALNLAVQRLKEALGEGALPPEERRCSYCLVRLATHFYIGEYLGWRYGTSGQSGCSDPSCDKSKGDVWGNLPVKEGSACQVYYTVRETDKFGTRTVLKIQDGVWVLRAGKWRPPKQ